MHGCEAHVFGECREGRASRIVQDVLPICVFIISPKMTKVYRVQSGFLYLLACRQYIRPVGYPFVFILSHTL